MKISTGMEPATIYKRPEQQQGTTPASDSPFDRKDTVTISGSSLKLFGQMQQKQTSMVEGLMKQRESIQEMKSKLTERTLEKGQDISSIEDQLKQYELQLTEIDKQIAEMEMEERQKALGKEKETGEKEGTGTDAQASLIKSAQSLEHVEMGNQVRNAMEREHRSLSSEMKMDASRGVYSKAKAERLNELENRMEDVEQSMMREMKEISEPTEEEENTEQTEPQEEM